MFETLVAGGIGAVAAALGWAIARWVGPAGTTRHRTTLLASFVCLFTLGSAALMPHARAWKQMFDQYLAKRARQHGESQPPASHPAG